ncbi:hypothetical protein ZOSMA_247G00030 [Zostera marina]|uniref:Uncharacterized protein n=1 Tax=Zostera marina TaxID=29655 RepID=A0A0K9PGZ0_ZOSMR|nr:hypothetical protein ZOSMA_247G00030 [Zostera marina]
MMSLIRESDVASRLKLHKGRLVYYFFESRESGNDPVMLWLTGGLGCSSELAIFYENDPFKFADDMSLARNNQGWYKVSNIIYVDQPTQVIPPTT